MSKMKQLLGLSLIFLLTALAAKVTAAEWQMLEPETLPIKRHEAAFVELEGKFYLLGGRGIKPVEVFDPETNRWDKQAPTPIELHHFQALAYDGKIYVIGAFTGPYPNEKPVPVFYIYDPKSDEWTTGAEIPENRRRGSAGVVMHGGKIYVVCGIVSGHQGDFVPWLDVYDPKTGEWTVLPDAPHARDHFQAAVADGQIVAVAGRTSSGWTKQVFALTVPEVDVFDVASGKWRTLDKPIPTPRAGNMATTVKSLVVILGGESGLQKTAHHQVEALDIKSGDWKVLSRLITGRHGTGVAYWNGALYTAAGCASRGGSPEQNSTEKLVMEK
jgi:N-acetylneuraminic acid mutarotase